MFNEFDFLHSLISNRYVIPTLYFDVLYVSKEAICCYIHNKAVIFGSLLVVQEKKPFLQKPIKDIGIHKPPSMWKSLLKNRNNDL